jgi:hypothetical protein
MAMNMNDFAMLMDEEALAKLDEKVTSLHNSFVDNFRQAITDKKNKNFNKVFPGTLWSALDNEPVLSQASEEEIAEYGKGFVYLFTEYVLTTKNLVMTIEVFDYFKDYDSEAIWKAIKDTQKLTKKFQKEYAGYLK